MDDTVLDEVSPSVTCCSECRHVKADVKDMQEQLTFLTHQIVQLMQVLCVGNCHCSSCQIFVGSSKLFSKNSVNHVNGSAVQNGETQDEPDVDDDDIEIDVKFRHDNFVPFSNGTSSMATNSRRCNNNNVTNNHNSRKRTVVGLDQILPKLLAERDIVVTSPSDVDEKLPMTKAFVVVANGGGGSASRASSATEVGTPPAIAAVANGNGAFDSMDEDSPLDGHHRPWLPKHHRYSADDMDANNGSHSTGSLSAVDQSCFLNESPCSSGSLELPKTSADTIISNDMLGIDDQNGIPLSAHERERRYGYASNMTSVSAGLPLVMPGPKATTFFCTICNREFSNVYYKRHMIVHANSRPYVCDVCGKRFNERSNMMKHKQRLHGP